ncbi:MAG: hypothetical protein H7Y59_15110 [Anaerolineales bacterium]|nr:hypothetical protein [Anaerolineales bacterium]
MKFDSAKFMAKPRTQLGWWAGGLAIAFIVVFLLTTSSVIIFSGVLILIIGVAAGVLGLYAMAKQGEGSWLVWLAILCGVFAILISLAAITQ